MVNELWLRMSSIWNVAPRAVITGSLISAASARSPLLLLCFTGNKAVIYGRIHHTVMKVSAWLSDWNLAADDHKNNHTKNCFHSGWSAIGSVPCHIWRLSQPAPGQVSPPHPARYQTLETNRGKRKKKMSECRQVSWKRYYNIHQLIKQRRH